MNLYYVTKFSPYFPFTLYCFYTKISSFMPVLSIEIVRVAFICLFSILRNSQLDSAVCRLVCGKRESFKISLLGNLTWKSCGNIKKCTRKCAPRTVLLSHSLSLFCFFDLLISVNLRIFYSWAVCSLSKH